ncbi:MAG: DUF4783 domain-containing protein [Cytophagaceae bacterium]|jgi:hypothetical protein|nr:DUF4783 domain-containing protein [Cytophagaceae bacterium]
MYKRVNVFLGLALSIWLSSFLVVTNGHQSVPELLEVVRIHIKGGQAKELSKYFSETVELQLLDQDRKGYNRTQAEFIVKDFFSKHPASDFKYTYKNIEKEEFKLAIGDYTYPNGTMRVTIVIKPSGTSYSIDSMVIERK